MEKANRTLIEFYEDRLERLGPCVESAGWGSEESQTLRFEILADIADLRGLSVCDLGCGLGDLYPYLKDRFGDLQYEGIDLSSKLIEAAKNLYTQGVFRCADILEEARENTCDYVLSSGALTYKRQDHEAYVARMLAAMMRMARRGVAVNFMSSYVDYRLEKNFHMSPQTAFTMGREITDYVTLRHDYPLREFTLYLFHDSGGGDSDEG